MPDMGKVCTEQHVPSYLNSMNELRSAGVDKLVCLAVSEPTAVQEWAKKAGLQGDKVCSGGTAQQGLCSCQGLYVVCTRPLLLLDVLANLGACSRASAPTCK